MWLSRAVSRRRQRPHSEARGINLNFGIAKGYYGEVGLDTACLPASGVEPTIFRGPIDWTGALLEGCFKHIDSLDPDGCLCFRTIGVTDPFP